MGNAQTAEAETPADLERVIAAFQSIPHCREIGLEVIDLKPFVGYMRLPYSPRLVGNPSNGVVHGGVITTLLDTLCGLVAMASVPSGTPIATLDLRIDYLRPGTPDKAILAKAECYRRTDSVAFLRGLAYHEHVGEPLAHCNGTFMMGGGGFTADGKRHKQADAAAAGGAPC